jgi:hypothetical protein
VTAKKSLDETIAAKKKEFEEWKERRDRRVDEEKRRAQAWKAYIEAAEKEGLSKPDPDMTKYALGKSPPMTYKEGERLFGATKSTYLSGTAWLDELPVGKVIGTGPVDITVSPADGSSIPPGTYTIGKVDSTVMNGDTLTLTWKYTVDGTLPNTTASGSTNPDPVDAEVRARQMIDALNERVATYAKQLDASQRELARAKTVSDVYQRFLASVLRRGDGELLIDEADWKEPSRIVLDLQPDKAGFRKAVAVPDWVAMEDEGKAVENIPLYYDHYDHETAEKMKVLGEKIVESARRAKKLEARTKRMDALLEKTARRLSGEAISEMRKMMEGEDGA